MDFIGFGIADIVPVEERNGLALLVRWDYDPDADLITKHALGRVDQGRCVCQPTL